MKAAWYSHNGPARTVLQVGELPAPAPQAGEVLVELHTSGVNPSDVKSRVARPVDGERIVPHSDGAGVVVAVGAGVPAGRIGQRVWIWNGQWQRPMGTAAQSIAIAQEQAVALPDNVGFEAGACLGIPALTALYAVRNAGELKGRTVLVTGAGSAVGHYATQFAREAGARVLGTAGSPARRDHALQAGAQHVIDYKREPVAERVKELTAGEGVDAVIDLDFSTTAPLLMQGLLKRHGRFVCYGSNQRGELPVDIRTLLWGGLALRFFLVYDLPAQERADTIAQLDDLLRSGRLVHAVGAVFGLDEIAAAHEAVEAGDRVGNVVLGLR